MQSSTSSAPMASRSSLGSSSSQDNDIDSNGSSSIQPLDLLSQGKPVAIRIDMKTLLCHVMGSLGPKNEPIFEQIDCGDAGVKFSVKLDVSSLRSVSGERISQSIVFGEPALNINIAETSAAWKALKQLNEKHLVKFEDFSSRVAQNLDSYKTYDLVIAGLRSLENIFGQWDLLFARFEKFTVDLEQKQFNLNGIGDQSAEGLVFAFPADCLTSVLNDLRIQTHHIRVEMKNVDNDLRKHENSTTLKKQLLLRQGHYHTVEISSKEILEYLLTFLGVEDAKYTSSPLADGRVRSTLKLKFPYFDIYQFGGAITIDGHGSSSVAANEKASFEALLFIEKHFPVKLVDWNFSLRKKASRQQTDLVVMLSKIIEQGQKLKKIWYELINHLEEQHDLFSLDPTSIFTEETVASQIHAYKTCARVISDMREDSSKSFAKCVSDFAVLMKVSWECLLVKSKLHK